MTLDDWQRRDMEIMRLEALGRARTADQRDELTRLRQLRRLKRRRVEDAIRAGRRKVAQLEALARQYRLSIPGEPA